MARAKALEEDLLTDLTYYILLALVVPMHGYGIMQAVQDMSSGEMTIGPASLYTTLKKLQDAQLIEPSESEDERRKTYALTERGKDILKKDIGRRIRMVELGQKAMKMMGGIKDETV